MSPALCANYLFMSLKIHTPHSHTHTAHTHPARHTSHLCREPSNALHTLRRPSGKFLKHMCSLPPSFQAVPTSFCLTSLSHSFSLSLPSILQLMVGSCLLGSRCLALCSCFSVCSSMLSLVFSFWFTCHRSAFGQHAHSLLSLLQLLLHSRTNSISSQLTV